MGQPNPDLYETMLDARAAASELPYLVYCANCEDAFLRKGKDCAHILDLALAGELRETSAGENRPGNAETAAATAAARGIKLPHLQEKRARALELKRELAALYGPQTGGDGAPPPGEGKNGESGVSPGEITLRIPDEVRSHMDAALVLDEEVAETILDAERQGDKFVERGGGASLACLVKPNVTYWVEYGALGDGAYEVYNVYSHRMRFEVD
jgi:hypothetical protein